ncbi:MAG TPA: multicopper oxidase domain-containing protein [Nitrososphaeraceae archaeon]|nr:multicopper oxidase domain-containing protein [Nitrososphaeraceae archaeon]
MMMSTPHLSASTTYHSVTFVIVVVTIAFFVVSMVMILLSQLAIAEKYVVHDNNNNNHKQNDVELTASTKTMMMPATPHIATKTKSTTPDLSLNSIPVGQNCAKNTDDRPNALEYLTYFNCGHVTQYKNGTLLRHFSLIISENKNIPISDISTKDPVLFHAWTFNDTIPGPTMRMTEGDHVEITVYNSKSSQHPHSLHMHSIHSGIMDGVYGNGGAIGPGQNYTYSFVASPYGVYPYHCHVASVQSHINHGLYGVIIIDPKTPRPPAKEMVMIMNGYNLVDDYKSNESGILRPPTAAELRTDFNKATHIGQAIGHPNQIYSVNGPAFIYRDHPIQLIIGQLYRIYLVNMLEFDPINSFHLHGNMFDYYPAGTGLNPSYKTDIVELGQGNRGIVEFTYDKPGMFMFHAHINGFTDLGWMGMFDVLKNGDISH